MGAVRDLMNELRRRGATVYEWSDWDGRGNQGVSQISPVGAVLHHTGTGYGFAFGGLAFSTRDDLYGGALCNFAGNSDGSFTVIASGLAWHAGQGAGPSLGPLASVSGNMNGRTVGLEIVYPGNSPMTDAQYNSMILFGRCVADLFAGGNAEAVRAHAETNGYPGDGKWDPGFAPGKTIDMQAVRTAIRNFTGAPAAPKPEDDNVALLNFTIRSNDDEEIPWQPLAIPYVNGSLSVPAVGGQAWIGFQVSNSTAKFEIWRASGNQGTLWKTVTLQPDTYTPFQLPKDTHGLSFRYLEGQQNVSGVLETYRP